MLLVIDNYDSFTYNVVDYFGKLYTGGIEIYRNDQISISQIESKNPRYLVISPGPKSPSEAGISEAAIDYFYTKLPILGICLGHQAIGEVFGGKIVQAKTMMHGKTSEIICEPDPFFEGLPNPFVATRYHSLVIEKQSLPENGPIQVLAHAKDDGEIMAIRHRQYPVYGVQFHPESILTENGLKLLSNFLR
jgi:anthranilate synthase component 2